MKPYFVRNASHLSYLEPPHLHNPASVSGVASLPTSVLSDLPEAVQSAMYNLQQSTSIVYASFIRLQDLLQERFERLLPTVDPDGEISFSESSFFNYINSLSAERTYLLSDAHPDWRHKASLAQVAVEPYYNLHLHAASSYLTTPHTVRGWWEGLQSAVASWCEYANAVHIPDYEDTVGEYLAIQKQTPALAIDFDDTPLETPMSVATPPYEKECEPVQLCQIKDKDFPHPLLPEALASNTLGLGLSGMKALNKQASTETREITLRTEGNIRGKRTDSGIGMDDQHP